MEVLGLLVITLQIFGPAGGASTSVPLLAKNTNQNEEMRADYQIDTSVPAEPLNPSEFEAAKSMQNKNHDRNEPVFENEVLYDRSFRRASFNGTRNGERDQARRWPKPRDKVLIPYIISSKFDQNQRVLIAKAFQNFHEKTCIRFVPRMNQRDYVHIVKGNGCDSNAGRIGGEQTVSLGRGCDYTDIAIHELNHAVGFWHEQNRPDRDSYVKVYLQNVKPEHRFNFNKLSPRQVTSFGVKYDTNSIMHYDKYAFSKDPKRYIVMKPKIPNEYMGYAKVLSKSDILKIKRMYNCGGRRHPVSERQGQNENEFGNPSEAETFDPSHCNNFHENCTTFASMESCEKNSWLKVNCRDACDICCKSDYETHPCQDINGKCPIWASNGACEDHEEYMKLYCPYSCQICQA